MQFFRTKQAAQQGGDEAFEMTPTLEGGRVIRPAYGRANNTENPNGKEGNDQDKRDMQRVGKTQELEVSRQHRSRHFQNSDQTATEGLQVPTALCFRPTL